MSREAIDYLANADPVLGGLMRAVGPCRLEPEAHCHPFEILARAIAHQQLNGTAANTILRRLTESCGAGAFPSPEQVLGASAESLRAAGFSFAKVAALRDLAEKTLAAVVPDAATLRELDDAEIIARLTQVRGVGRWTVEMLLVFHLGRADVLPVDDFGVRSGFQAAYGLARLPRPQVLAAWGERWKPYRTTAAWYLWQALALKRAGTLPVPQERIRLPRIRRRRRAVSRVKATRPARAVSRVKAAGPARAASKTPTRKRAAARAAAGRTLRGGGTSSAPPRRSDARKRSRPRQTPRSRAPGSRR
jgi:DNA-3-methyladenine glycosylase II